jgi:hypothetical protein
MQQLHQSLTTISSKYAKECCWARAPVLVHSAVAKEQQQQPVTGSIVAQWHQAGPAPRAALLLLLYFIASPAGNYVYGALEVSVADVRELQRKVSEAMIA